jgi:hypothetical protein
LWHILSEAAERAVARHRQCLRVLVPDREGKAAEQAPEEKADSPWRSERFANRVRTRHATVHALLEAGHSRRSIGRQLNVIHGTVKRLADAAKPEDLFCGQWQYKRTSVLDEYKPYLDERWDEGCRNAWRLWEEIVPLGYRGSYGREHCAVRDDERLAGSGPHYCGEAGGPEPPGPRLPRRCTGRRWASRAPAAGRQVDLDRQPIYQELHYFLNTAPTPTDLLPSQVGKGSLSPVTFRSMSATARE